MNARHPSDRSRLARAVRQCPFMALLAFFLLGCALGLVLFLAQLGGLIGPAGLRW